MKKPVRRSTSANVSSMPEVVGDAGLLVDPEDVNDIKEKIAELDANIGLRRELSERGLRRAKLFSWEQAAMKLLGVWRELAGR